MFKPWKSDKNKIKAVFMMQFHATQVTTLIELAQTVTTQILLSVKAYSFLIGTEVKEIYLNSIYSARSCWEGDSETGESCRPRWSLFLGKSCIRNGETH